MGEVVDFGKAKEDRTPHGTGPAKCLCCGHQWEATAPVGTTRLECPECKTMRGVYVLPFGPNELFACSCGNELFYATPNGVFCPNCGIEDDHLADN